MAATTRLTPKNSTVLLGTAAGGSQLWTGVDLRNWEIEVTQKLEDYTCLSDLWEVLMREGGAWRLTAEKACTTLIGLDAIYDMITTGVPIFMSTLRGGATVAGSASGSGECWIESARFVNGATGPAIENLVIRGTGAFTAPAT